MLALQSLESYKLLPYTCSIVTWLTWLTGFRLLLRHFPWLVIVQLKQELSSKITMNHLEITIRSIINQQ